MQHHNEVPKELCRIKKAVEELIKQNLGGVTFREICHSLQQDSIFMGTYRNLLSMTLCVLGLLVEEGAILYMGKGSSKIFLYAGNRYLH